MQHQSKEDLCSYSINGAEHSLRASNIGLHVAFDANSAPAARKHAAANKADNALRHAKLIKAFAEQERWTTRLVRWQHVFIWEFLNRRMANSIP